MPASVVLPVVERGKLVGVVSLADIVHRLCAERDKARVNVGLYGKEQEGDYLPYDVGKDVADLVGRTNGSIAGAGPYDEERRFRCPRGRRCRDGRSDGAASHQSLTSRRRRSLRGARSEPRYYPCVVRRQLLVI